MFGVNIMQIAIPSIRTLFLRYCYKRQRIYQTILLSLSFITISCSDHTTYTPPTSTHVSSTVFSPDSSQPSTSTTHPITTTPIAPLPVTSGSVTVSPKNVSIPNSNNQPPQTAPPPPSPVDQDNPDETNRETIADIYALVLPTSEEVIALGDPLPETEITALSRSAEGDLDPSESMPIDHELLEMTTTSPLDEQGNSKKMGNFKQQYSLKENPTVKVDRTLTITHPRCRKKGSQDPLKDCLRFSENQQIPSAHFQGSQYIDEAISIETSQTVCTAPCGIHFTAHLDTEKFRVEHDWNDVAYSWNFNDPTAAFSALQEDFAFGKSANFAQGPVAAHVFNQPGHYQVTLQIAEQNGQYSATTKDIVVTDANAQFPQQQTLCLSQESDFSECPAGAQLFTHWDQATAVFASNQRGNSYRLLLKAGETFNATKTTLLSRYGPYYVSKFGEGENPIIKTDANISVFRALRVDGLTIASIRLEGSYESNTGLGNSYSAQAINTTSTNNITIYQTQSTGIGNHALITGGSGVVIADNRVTNWHDYASLNQGWDEDKNGVIDEYEYAHQVAYVGNSFKQSVNAVSGAGNKGGQPPRWADHGPIRSAGSFKMVVSQNDLLSTTGWSSHGAAHQPVLRYNQSGVPNHSGVINRNRMSGGWIVLQLSPQNTRHTACLGKLLVERNHIIGSGNTIYLSRLSYGDTTMRNNILEVPDVKDDGSVVAIR